MHSRRTASMVMPAMTTGIAASRARGRKRGSGPTRTSPSPAASRANMGSWMLQPPVYLARQ